MHKGVILLTKAENRAEAIMTVNEFMERYQDRVWDWFVIGNRWHNTLAPSDKVTEFNNVVTALYPQLKGSYSIDQIENDVVRPIIQAEWEKLGLKGVNPYYSSYGHSVKDSENDYNVVPLSECIDIVTKWIKDLKKEAQTLFNKLRKERLKENKEGKGMMSAYYAKLYSDCVYGDFCFESNVFDITTEGAEQIPEDITGYYAVMVDMHN